MNKTYDIGIIGCGVMGRNLALNLLDYNFSVAVFDADREALARIEKETQNVNGLYLAESIPDIVESLARPRILLLMIPAGEPTDVTIKLLLPLLNTDDIIVDGGNSHPEESQRQFEILERGGFRYIGMGISGGEKGARTGPSLMPGGSKKAWKEVEKIFTTIAAKDSDGIPCCRWVGPGNAGHFVKMVHNGIEYAIMQAISDVYLVMRDLLQLNHEKIASTFGQWGKDKLESYLLEITSKILLVKEKEGGSAVDQILSVAGQKGTGSWATQYALELGIPANILATAVFSRNLSVTRSSSANNKKSNNLDEKTSVKPGSEISMDDLKNALYISCIGAFEQGFNILNSESERNKWEISLLQIAGLWKEGCILRGRIIDEIQHALVSKNSNFLLAEKVLGVSLGEKVACLRAVNIFSTQNNVPVPALSSTLQYFDLMKYKSLPFNLLQAQRDCFGSHGYSRTDKDKTRKFHRDWLGSGEESEM